MVARLRNRDEAAFALLLDKWSSGMLRVARTFVSTEDSAAEVLQETWLSVIRGISGFEGRSSLKTWVYRILVNGARRRAVRESKMVPSSTLTSHDDSGPTVDPARFRGPNDPYPGDWWAYPVAWPSASPEQATLASEIRSEVAIALADLPDRQRVVLTLRDIEGHTGEEVCAILDISAGNQRVLLHRARAFVRGKLEEYFTTTGERAEDGTVAP
jgi:RNA polymerase sigma-70 factor (ECF subfamily)